MTELNNTLDHLGWFQMLLAFGFVASYATALTPFAGARGQRRSALLALVCGVGFAAITDPWTNGVLLMLMAVGGMALFVGTAWVLSRLASGTSRHTVAVPTAPAASDLDERMGESPLHGGAASSAH